MAEKASANLLRTIDLFTSFGHDEITEIAGHMNIRSCKRGEVILNEEDTTEYMYFVLDGKVKVFNTTPDGKESILAVHGPGQFFGELALLDGKTAPATVSALESSRVALLNRADFRDLLFTQPKFLEGILGIFCARLRDAWTRVKMLNYKNASQRIRLLLMMLAEQNGAETAEGLTLDIKLTHQNIADMAGLTRESVTRVLDRWQRDGVIAVHEKRLTILNRDFLHEDFDMV